MSAIPATAPQCQAANVFVLATQSAAQQAEHLLETLGVKWHEELFYLRPTAIRLAKPAAICERAPVARAMRVIFPHRRPFAASPFR